MGWLYRNVCKPALFRLDAEHAHEIGVDALAALGRFRPLCALMEKINQLPASLYKPVECFGLKFPNAVGLAAGFDKNGRAWPAAAALGFGHVEIGTVTLHAQPGNPRPRAFRYPEAEGVINRMGFNNGGAAALAKRLSKQTSAGQRKIPLGINLGKSKVTTLDKAQEDYLGSFRLLADHADYVVVNVSSPNTPGLRELQDASWLQPLLAALVAENQSRVAAGKTRRPLLLKIAPDLNFAQIDAALGVIADLKLDGVIATNTTLARPGSLSAVNEAGGLSGRPVQKRSTEIINYIARTTNGRLPIIGVGGIMDEAGAGEKLDAGATLVQLYTGLIYRGPFFAREIAYALAAGQRR
ncbi:quinone-dependent dihydroorotate dehydrogenase [Oleiharenicola lentus]|uniref:quinone-dependent dihydroorotate dehydrogenase n=1 Tax=Oleiharenicola lentus TaxID=2508720 RepID=UPI003F67E478